MSKQLMRRWLARSLPSLKQGSTLSIRSKAKNTSISIRPEWRDDGYVSILQDSVEGSGPHLQILKQDEQMTSMGRPESHVSVHLDDASFSQETLTAESEIKFPENSIVLDDASVVPDGPEWSPPPEGLDRVEYCEGVALLVANDEEIQGPETKLSVTVPEKMNIDCNLENGGSIQVHGKIEGDVRLKTNDGNVIVKKLRGHVLDIHVQGHGNTIYSSDLLEAGSLFLSTPASGRIRAKRIHAGNCSIQIGSRDEVDVASSASPPPISSRETIDVDDAGAVCDISSLYMSNDATINYYSHTNYLQPVRIKSHHGHIIVDATSPKPAKKNEMTDTHLPIVDLGGVNGSCEVFVQETSMEGADSSSENDDNDWVSCHVHFDSILPDSVSVLKAATAGDVQITVDRKVESDMRFLCADNLSNLHLDHLLIDSGDEDFETFASMLTSIDASSSSSSTKKAVKIRTMAFTEKCSLGLPAMKNGQFVDGWIENRSEEPDSRFDRKVRGDGGSIGKIRLEGAETQALRGFQQQESAEEGGEEENKFPRPIVAVASTGGISLETLSWLGNIARRYGLDDKRETDDLGRTATRRGRSLDPSNE